VAETFAIVVHPSALDHNDLTVADAMRQVLDVIEIVDRADEIDAPADLRVVWRLKSASTNSPFSVVAEGWSSDPAISVAVRAANAKQVATQAIRALVTDGQVAGWLDGAALRAARRFLERNVTGVGQTEFVPATARVGIAAIEKVLVDEKFAIEDETRSEIGSIEGEIIAASRYYGSPSLILRERLSADRVNCVLSEHAADRIGPEHKISDIWSGRRIIVTGLLHYNSEGVLSKVEAEDLEVIDTVPVDLNEIRSMNLTDGLSPIEFLDLIRGSDHG
jgi:hypothetical protein